jgi:DNA gyrase subunit B
VVYNSIDEAVVGCCDKILVDLRQDGTVSVEDNGRGIPIETHPDTELSALETVMTTLHAGAKFGSRSYKVSGGLHGVGVSVVNALSSWLRVKVKRDGKIYYQEYRQGKPQCQVTAIGDADGNGTVVEFIPNGKTFGKLNYDFEFLTQRLRELAYLIPRLEITIQDESQDKELTFYFEGGLASFVRHLNQHKNALHPSPIYLSKEVNGTVVEVAIQYTDTYSELVLSFANYINTADGGSHLTGFRSAMTRVLNDYLRQLKLVKDSESALLGEDVREGLKGKSKLN